MVISLKPLGRSSPQLTSKHIMHSPMNLPIILVALAVKLGVGIWQIADLVW
jgi:hypothetical protein